MASLAALGRCDETNLSQATMCAAPCVVLVYLFYILSTCEAVQFKDYVGVAT